MKDCLFGLSCTAVTSQNSIIRGRSQIRIAATYLLHGPFDVNCHFEMIDTEYGRIIPPSKLL